MSEWNKETPQAISLEEVELFKDYALLISTNAGLWRYNIGDTIQFVSKSPYRIKVTGRTKHFINAFGEEVMVENTDKAIAEACQVTGAEVSEYTVAPVYLSARNKGSHHWLIEFLREPVDMKHFTKVLDQNLQAINSDYEAKRHKNMALRQLQITALPPGTFHQWMRARGKFGGQHKVPRLSNNREYLEDIFNFLGNKNEVQG